MLEPVLIDAVLLFCIEALKRSGYSQAGPLIEWCEERLAKHQTDTREHFEDLPEVRDWVWADT